jgi:hypothetical protein
MRASSSSIIRKWAPLMALNMNRFFLQNRKALIEKLPDELWKLTARTICANNQMGRVQLTKIKRHKRKKNKQKQTR